MVGAEFQLKQSKMSASVDSNGKVDSNLEVAPLCSSLAASFPRRACGCHPVDKGSGGELVVLVPLMAELLACPSEVVGGAHVDIRMTNRSIPKYLHCIR